MVDLKLKGRICLQPENGTRCELRERGTSLWCVHIFVVRLRKLGEGRVTIMESITMKGTDSVRGLVD